MKKSKSLSNRTDNNVLQIDQKRREEKELAKWKIEVLEYVLGINKPMGKPRMFKNHRIWLILVSLFFV